jgi:RNA recognition motif-containing protein
LNYFSDIGSFHSDLIAESLPDPYDTKEQLFIANLADSVSDSQLRDFLKAEANILEIKRCKGFAFVTVASRADCERLFEMKNKTIAGKELVIQYSGVKPKSEIGKERNKKGR